MWRKLFLFSAMTVLASLIFAAPVTIQFWHAMGGTDRIQLLQNLANEFMQQNPDIKVEVQYTGSYTDTMTKMIAAVRAGNPPDLVMIYDIGTQMMIDSGAIIPIQNMIDKDPSFDINTLVPASRGYYTVGGKLYSMPFNSSNPVIFYNKTLFEKVGLDPNNPPTTFSEFMTDAKKLTIKNSSGNTIQYGFTFGSGEPLAWFFEQFMAVQNSLLLSNNNGRDGRATKAVFNNEAGLRVFNFFNDMIQNGSAINAGPGWDNARQIFISQRAAMLITSTSDVNMMVKAAQSGNFSLGVMFLPHPSDVPYGGVIVGGASLWMVNTNNTQREDATWKFLKFLEGVDAQISWSKGTGYFPVNKNSIIKLLYQGYYAQNPPYLVTVLQLLMSNVTPATMGGATGAFPQIRTAVDNAFGKMFTKAMTPQQAIQWAQDQANQALANYNSLY